MITPPCMPAGLLPNANEQMNYALLGQNALPDASTTALSQSNRCNQAFGEEYISV